jgi:hypothetical protein
MMSCAFCKEPATTKVVSNPEQVCLEHALEFWTGLLDHVRDCGDPSELRAIAIAAAGPSPVTTSIFRFASPREASGARKGSC